MDAVKYTPGPWAVSNGVDQYVCAGGVWIAASMGIRGDEGAANARLIAAAPELLEACQALLASHRPGVGQCCKASDLGIAAIKKVLGQ